MPKFMIAYHGGGQPSSKEKGMAHMKKWQDWVAGLGDAVVNPGTPFRNSKLVTAEAVQSDEDPNSMKGFAVVLANDIEGALEIAKADPFLELGGTIRVSEMVDMNA